MTIYIFQSLANKINKARKYKNVKHLASKLLHSLILTFLKEIHIRTFSHDLNFFVVVGSIQIILLLPNLNFFLLTDLSCIAFTTMCFLGRFQFSRYCADESSSETSLTSASALLLCSS